MPLYSYTNERVENLSIIQKKEKNQNGWKLQESIKHNLTVSCVYNKHRML